MNNQKMIMSSLNSLTELVKQLIQQQHTTIPLRRNEIVGDGGQVVATVGTYQESEEDNNILPSIVREISATDMPLSQPPPSYSMICVFYDTRIRMIRVFYDTRIRMIRVSYAYHTRIIRVSYVKIYASGTV
jgi:hypothetical protein